MGAGRRCSEVRMAWDWAEVSVEIERNGWMCELLRR